MTFRRVTRHGPLGAGLASPGVNCKHQRAAAAPSPSYRVDCSPRRRGRDHRRVASTGTSAPNFFSSLSHNPSKLPFDTASNKSPLFALADK